MPLTTVQSGMMDSIAQYNSFKNRIINGAMVIDQRYAGASVTPTAAIYTLDRWLTNNTQASKFSVQQNAGSVTPPAGYKNYLGVTSLSAYSVLTSDFFSIVHPIEGLNCADLAWGTASAATVTLSFWVRSSLTGTFGGSLNNSDFSRSYPFSYTISAANTWEQKSVTIAGDTTGTWLTTNGKGIQLYFNLGAGATYSTTAGAWASGTYVSSTGATSVVGTNGATWYVTGVQLEKGSTATAFDYRPYTTELQLCQRYFEKSFDIGTAPVNGGATTLATFAGVWGGMTNNASPSAYTTFQVAKRATPTLQAYGNSSGYWNANGSWSISSFNFQGSGTGGFSPSQQVIASTVITYGHWTASAEL